VTTGLTVDVTTELAVDLFDRVSTALENPRQALEAVADDIRDYEAEVFRTGGLGDWPSVEADWAQRKRGNRTLVDTGELLKSLTRYPATGAVQKITDDSVTVATTLVAGIMAQRGDGGPERNPAPAPSRRHVERWAQTLLQGLIDQTGR
jgi:hypothetical protein